jgi:hypothetical protein
MVHRECLNRHPGANRQCGQSYDLESDEASQDLDLCAGLNLRLLCFRLRFFASSGYSKPSCQGGQPDTARGRYLSTSSRITGSPLPVTLLRPREAEAKLSAASDGPNSNGFRAFPCGPPTSTWPGSMVDLSPRVAENEQRDAVKGQAECNVRDSFPGPIVSSVVEPYRLKRSPKACFMTCPPTSEIDFVRGISLGQTSTQFWA